MIINAKIRQTIQKALKEDIGTRDVTTTGLIHKRLKESFVIIAKEPCIVCGMAIAEACFDLIDENIHIRPMTQDATEISAGKIIAHINGPARGILTAERTALNFLGWLSGISTLTSKFVDAIKDTKVVIMDTRKTTPSLRYLEKYAVKIGGGKNHRMGLYDQILIKDNHIKLSSIKEAISRAKKIAIQNKRIEIEAKTIGEFKQALSMDPDIIMLDNMSVQNIKEAIKLRDAYRIEKQDLGFKTILEVSGNINLDNVEEIAKTGVERISVGIITHSAPAIDFTLQVA